MNRRETEGRIAFPLLVSAKRASGSRLFVARGGRYHRRPMPTRVRRDHHRRRRSRTSRVTQALQRRVNNGLTDVNQYRSGRLLDRILAVPQIALAVPRLPAELLHRVIRQCGLEECGELLALVTPDQVADIFDLDLWRPAAPGLDEEFDADRFGTWLEVLMDADVSNAATTLAALDVDLVAAGLIEHVRVFDYAAVADYVTLDGEVSGGRAFDDQLSREIGGYLIAAKQTAFWDAITGVLVALAGEHGDGFGRLMRACCRLSNSRPEPDVDDRRTANEQVVLDLALDREERRDTQGYVTPAQARAFLQASRQIDLRHGARPSRDAMTHAYFSRFGIHPARAADVPPPSSRDHAGPDPDVPDGAVAAVVELLHEAGVMARVPRPLLEGSSTGAPRLARMRAHLQFVCDRDPDAYAKRSAELAYLANVMSAGLTIQSRPVAAEEASTAAVAVCNLGLEHWPAHWLDDEAVWTAATAAGIDLPQDFLIRHDLVSVFQVGWTVLYEDVCTYAADKLLTVLASLRCADADVQAALVVLRATLAKHLRAGVPWNTRDALEVIAMLDTPSWAALLGLIGELPILHAAVGALLARTASHVDPCAFEFISESRHIRQVHEFMDRLSGILRN